MHFFEQLLIQYSRSISSEMERCAREAHPNEGCALLFGTKFQDINPKNDTPRVVYVVKLVESIPSSQLSWGSFFIDEHRLFETSVTAKVQGYKLVGIFHSHPAPAKPSRMDFEYMSRIDGFKPLYAVWIIQSTLPAGNTRAYIFLQNKIHEVRQEIKA
ncbi:MAG: hypothetical protein RBG13Loki_1056 [Promethearchaeota archaeon CR_4]|nr:MAG: hypothetical protein RBG13Loki_1056 [Candidatus Lokiarchaeota archaeon CR_4]